MAEKKITLNVPTELLREAQAVTSGGITETVHQGLKLLAATDAYESMRRLRGKVKFSVNLDRLRDDKK